MKTDHFVTAAHVCGVLGISSGTLNRLLIDGKIPAPDRRWRFNAKQWRLSTIRSWNPQVAAGIETLLSIAPVRNAA